MARHICPILLLFPPIFSMAACQRQPANTSPPLAASPAANPPASADSGKPTIRSAGFINVVPGAMVSCDSVVEATVKWDLHGTHSDAKTVDVYVDDGSKVQLFAEGGASGQAKTGLWARPGIGFILKNKAGNETLDEVRISGPTCKVHS